MTVNKPTIQFRRVLTTELQRPSKVEANSQSGMQKELVRRHGAKVTHVLLRLSCWDCIESRSQTVLCGGITKGDMKTMSTSRPHWVEAIHAV